MSVESAKALTQYLTLRNFIVGSAIITGVACLIIGPFSLAGKPLDFDLSKIKKIGGPILTASGGILLIGSMMDVAIRALWPKEAKQKSLNHYYNQKLSNEEDEWEKKLQQIRQNECEEGASTNHEKIEKHLNSICYLVLEEVKHLFKQPILSDQDFPSRPDSQERHEIAKRVFLNNLPAIASHLHLKTQQILSSSGHTKKESEDFKLLNRQMRAILLYFLSLEREKSKFSQRYSAFVKSFWGNRTWNATIIGQNPAYYFPNLLFGEKEETINDFAKMLFAFQLYRRHYLLRLFPQKISNRVSISEKVWPLLQAAWYHGTRACTSLKETDFFLIPSGWLNQLGIVSFFGEMREGTLGVNMDHLSGTHLDRVEWSMDTYASGFHFSIEEEMNYVDRFLNMDLTSKYFLATYSRIVPRWLTAIKRYSLWDRESFVSKKEVLLTKIKGIEETFNTLEEDDDLSVLDETHPYYVDYPILKSLFIKLKEFLEDLPEPLTDGQKRNIQNNFPAVLGSLTLLPNTPTDYEDQSGEHLVFGEAQIGKDIQILCVPRSEKKKAEAWIKEDLPKVEILIFTFDDLKAAQTVNKKISPYLADFLSQKKLSKIL